MLNVICVWAPPGNEMEGWFTVDYVEKLYNSLKRNLDVEFKFHVLTDKGEELQGEQYNIVPLSGENDMYWNKIEAFNRENFTGPCLYIDLDVVICKNITNVVNRLLETKGRFFMLHQPMDGYANSSIMYWDDDFGHIYENFMSDIARNVYMFRRRGIGNMGDQGYIASTVDFEYLNNDEFASVGWVYKGGKRVGESPHHFLTFMSRDQKPHKMLEDPTVGELIKTHWI